MTRTTDIPTHAEIQAHIDEARRLRSRAYRRAARGLVRILRRWVGALRPRGRQTRTA